VWADKYPETRATLKSRFPPHHSELPKFMVIGDFSTRRTISIHAQDKECESRDPSGNSPKKPAPQLSKQLDVQGCQPEIL